MGDFSYKLKDYVCLKPFTRLEIYDEKVFACCSSWNIIPVGKTSELDKILNGGILKKIRKSVLDGTYTYCNKDVCPYLLHLIHDDYVGEVFREKDTIDIEKLYDIKGKLELKINIDYTCNLSCPSCRISVFTSNREQRIDIKIKMDEIVDIFGQYTSSIHLTGSGDPFASEVFRNFLINFDETKFPLLEKIYIYTNANLLNERMWNKIHKVHKYIDWIEISIDAATEETYKKVRRNGNWNKLFENIRFIMTIPAITNINYSFVVQDTNYKEMEEFSNLITDLRHDISYGIFFNRILNWGTFTEEEFEQKKIWDESHPEFKNFLVELNKALNTYNTHFDMAEIIDKYSLTGIIKLI